MSFLKAKKLIVLIIASCMIITMVACSISRRSGPEETSQPPEPVSRSTTAEYKSIMGILVGTTENSIIIEAEGEQHLFSTEKTNIESTDCLIIGNQVVVYYYPNNDNAAIKIEAVKNSFNQQSDFEIYQILGTADSITGLRWKNMLTHRSSSVKLAEKYRNLVFVNMNPNEKSVYLTFDDGPDLTNTKSVMNTLIKYNAKATFFFTGENMKKYKSIVKMVYDNGFKIGIHGYDHTSLASLPHEEIENQLNKTNDILEEITGKRSSLMRPPYGDLNYCAINTIKSLNELIFLWSLDTLDWAQSDKSEILRNIKENLRPGDIILMHTSADKPLTAQILPEIIEYIQSQGYKMEVLPGT